MRKITLLLIAIHLILNGNGQQYLKIGDNIYDYFFANPIKYNSANYKLSNWYEGNVKFYSYTQGDDTTKPHIINSCQGKFLFGVLQGGSPNSYYLFDTDGDKILDYKTDEFLLPPWVIEVNSPNKNSKNNIKPIMDLLYESFNSDLGPSNPKMIAAIQSFTQYEADTSMANRDLVYLLKFYIDNSGNADLALKTIERLKELYNQRFDAEHGLIFLFYGETYLDLGNKNEAKQIFEKILKIDSSYVPALVYDYKLETDKKSSKGKLKILKKEYPNHWLIKKL